MDDIEVLKMTFEEQLGVLEILGLRGFKKILRQNLYDTKINDSMFLNLFVKVISRLIKLRRPSQYTTN